MKIWSDSLSYLNIIHNGYVNHIERFLSDGYRDNYTSDECVAERSYFNAEYVGPREGECAGDCDGCDADYFPEDEKSNFCGTRNQFTLDYKYVSLLAKHRLQLVNALHMQTCDVSHRLICNPIEAGNIAVIDEEALAFLGHFRVPTTVQEIIATKNLSIELLLPAVLVFLDLGFLYDLDQPHVVCSEQSGGAILSAWLHITNACNLRCHYCYVSKSPDHMEQETSRRAVDAIIRSAVRHGYRRVHLKYAGGEAALQMPQVIATHDYAQQQAQEHHLRLSATLLSNGTIMTQRMIEQLKERHIHISISLDGIGRAHDQQRPFIDGTKGSFAMVDRTISRLLANDLRPSINVTVSQRNIAGLSNLLSYILERDIHFALSYYRENDCSASMADLQFSEAQMIDGMRAAFAYIERHLPKQRIIDSLIDKGSMRAPHQYTCGIGRNYLVINQRGEVAKCHADITRTVTTIQADDPLHEIRSEHTGMQAIDVDHKEGCRTCTWRYWCAGGCPMVTYRMTGRNDIRSPNCAIYKALYPEAVRLEALRLLKYAKPIAFENPLSREV
jgi:uncharacterized protein